MTTENYVDSIDQVSQIIGSRTAPIVGLAILFIIVLIAFGFFITEQRKKSDEERKQREADREMERMLREAERAEERAQREADRKARETLDNVRITREDDNLRYTRQVIERLLATIDTSNSNIVEMIEALQKTHAYHEDLSDKVSQIIDEIAMVKEELSKQSGVDNRMMTTLQKLERDFAKLLKELQEGVTNGGNIEH